MKTNFKQLLIVVLSVTFLPTASLANNPNEAVPTMLIENAEAASDAVASDTSTTADANSDSVSNPNGKNDPGFESGIVYTRKHPGTDSE